MVYDTGRTEPFPEAEDRSYQGGCRSQATCQSCGAIVADPICLCMPVFTCPRCGHKNGELLSLAESFLPVRFGDMMEAFSNEYLFEALGFNPPPPSNKEVATGDFPEEIGEIIAKLTKEEAAKLIDYIRTKS